MNLKSFFKNRKSLQCKAFNISLTKKILFTKTKRKLKYRGDWNCVAQNILIFSVHKSASTHLNFHIYVQKIYNKKFFF